MDDSRRDERESQPATQRASLEGPRASLDAIPMPGITRRRVAVLVAGLVAIWLVGVFARQVGDASAAATKADDMRARNAAVASQIADLKHEVALSQGPEYVQAMGHAYGLGGANEVPFVVDPNAAPLPSNAPGSVGIRDVTAQAELSPLETWLKIIFGPGD